MYLPDEQDQLRALAVVPESAGEAPRPLVVATARQLFLAYLLKPVRQRPPSFDVEQLVDQMTSLLDAAPQPASQLDAERPELEPTALLEFREPVTHAWYPDRDSVYRHPLAARGLHSSAAFEVRHSSWVRALPGSAGRHFVVTFDGSVFECIAAGVKLSSLDRLEQVLPEVQRRLLQRQARSAPSERA